MELRQLRSFVAAAEELHFGRAAARLHLAQPSLSRQVAALERALGVQLFSRARRRVVLTSAGEAFLEGARRTLAQADEAARDALRAQRGERGRLALGFVQSATFEALPRLLRAFRHDCPGVVIDARAMTTVEQVAALRDGQLGAGLLRPPVDDRSLALRVVSRDPLMAALPRDHPLAALERVPLRELAGEPFVLYRRADGPGVHDTILGLCRAAGFSPRIVQEAGEAQTIAALVAAGLGVSLVIAPVPPAPGGAVVYRPLAEDPPPWELALAWRRDDPSAVLARFLRVAQQS